LHSAFIPHLKIGFDDFKEVCMRIQLRVSVNFGSNDFARKRKGS
jgi:hypothetical protein